MQSRCPLCRVDLQPGQGVLLKAGRKPLALVHADCAAIAQQGVALFGKLALMASGMILKARAPDVMNALQLAHQTMQRARALHGPTFRGGQR